MLKIISTEAKKHDYDIDSNNYYYTVIFQYNGYICYAEMSKELKVLQCPDKFESKIIKELEKAMEIKKRRGNLVC